MRKHYIDNLRSLAILVLIPVTVSYVLTILSTEVFVRITVLSFLIGVKPKT